MKTNLNSASFALLLVLWTLSPVNGWSQTNPGPDSQSGAREFAKSATIKDTDGDGLIDDYERGVGRYELIRDGFTWELAKADAEKRGGHLATIVSQAEWDSIVAVLGNFYEGKSVFIGERTLWQKADGFLFQGERFDSEEVDSEQASGS